eukprot:3818843-Pyramimonas_sp.AAC.2
MRALDALHEAEPTQTKELPIPSPPRSTWRLETPLGSLRRKGAPISGICNPTRTCLLARRPCVAPLPCDLSPLSRICTGARARIGARQYERSGGACLGKKKKDISMHIRTSARIGSELGSALRAHTCLGSPRGYLNVHADAVFIFRMSCGMNCAPTEHDVPCVLERLGI